MVRGGHRCCDASSLRASCVTGPDDIVTSIVASLRTSHATQMSSLRASCHHYEPHARPRCRHHYEQSCHHCEPHARPRCHPYEHRDITANLVRDPDVGLDDDAVVEDPSLGRASDSYSLLLSGDIRTTRRPTPRSHSRQLLVVVKRRYSYY